MKMIESLSLTLKMKIPNKEECDVIYNALKYETFYSPNDRARVKIDKESDDIIELEINAQDPVSARAALNSYLRWLELAQELTKLNIL